jgi:hypothetical protein
MRAHALSTVDLHGLQGCLDSRVQSSHSFAFGPTSTNLYIFAVEIAF